MNFLDIFKNMSKKSYTPSLFNWTGITPRGYNKADDLLEFKRYTYAVISRISSSIGQIEFKLEQKKNGKWNLLEKHPIMQILNNPNPEQSTFQFFEMYATWLKLTGDVFIFTDPNFVGWPTRLQILPSDKVDVVVSDDRFGSVGGYVFNKPNGEQIPFEINEICHFKTPNPRNPYRGKSVIEAAWEYLQTDEFATSFTNQSLKNSGRPSGIVSFKGTINNDDFSLLKKKFKQEYSGIENAGKTMFVRSVDGISFQKLGVDIGEVGLETIKKMSRDDILFMFGVSKSMLGVTDDVNLSNGKEQSSIFYDNVVSPEMLRICDQLQHFLFPFYRLSKEEYRLTFKNPNPLKEDEENKDLASGLNKYYTYNEVRAKKGLDPIVGGDTIYQPSNYLPVGFVVDNPTNNVDNTQDNPETKAVENKLEHKDCSCKKKQNNQEIETIDYPDELVTGSGIKYKTAESMRVAIYKIQLKFLSKYTKALNKVFKWQLDTIIEQNSTKAYVPLNYKFDLDESLKHYQDALTDISEQEFLQIMAEAFKIVGEDFQYGLSEQSKIYIQNRIRMFASSVDTRTINKISQALIEAANLGESNDKIMKRISSIYEGISTTEAARIARTETIAIANESTLETYRQAPSVVAKEWFAEPSACEFCMAMQGKIIGLETDFISLGATMTGTDGGIMSADYDNVTHPPLHPNCICTLLPVTQEILNERS